LFATPSFALDLPEIKKMMQQLSKDLAQAQTAMLIEDTATLEKAAMAVADHPMAPLTERMKVMATLLTDMSDFKGWDEKTHESAKALAQAARAKDQKAQAIAYTGIIEGCMGCHANFRAKLRD